MFNYTEYKTLHMAVTAGLEAAIVIHESGNGGLTLETPGEISVAAIEACNFTDRMADVMGTKGFLGFMRMIDEYPVEFKEDLDEWVRVHTVSKRCIDILLSEGDEDIAPIVRSDVDVVYTLRFIINPTRFIKG